MDIYKEIELKKKQLKEQELINKYQQKTVELQAEDIIHDIVKLIKDIAIHRIATNKGPFFRRGLLGTVKYIKITYKISQDDDGSFLKIYSKLYPVRHVILSKIASAINNAGFCNTTVSYSDSYCYFYIETELNLPK